MRAYNRFSAAFNVKRCVTAMRLTKCSPESLRNVRIRIGSHGLESSILGRMGKYSSITSANA